jgi:hypothetical protein
MRMSVLLLPGFADSAGTFPAGFLIYSARRIDPRAHIGYNYLDSNGKNSNMPSLCGEKGFSHQSCLSLAGWLQI